MLSKPIFTRRFFQLSTRLVLGISFLCTLSACVSLIDATTSEPLQPDPSERTFGEYLDDKKLKTVVSVNLIKASEQLKDAHIRVRAYRGMILLTGQVPNKSLKQLAGKTARDIIRVKHVFNELEIGQSSGVGRRLGDAWIKTKIKTKLMLNKDIDSTRIKITVENRVVYLLGVLSQHQADLITDVVTKTKGVTKVVRAIEYLSTKPK